MMHYHTIIHVRRPIFPNWRVSHRRGPNGRVLGVGFLGRKQPALCLPARGPVEHCKLAQCAAPENFDFFLHIWNTQNVKWCVFHVYNHIVTNVCTHAVWTPKQQHTLLGVTLAQGDFIFHFFIVKLMRYVITRMYVCNACKSVVSVVSVVSCRFPNSITTICCGLFVTNKSATSP